MGKDLKGKELGTGISQRKDGYYTARFTSRITGKTVQKYFKKLSNCKEWYINAKYNDEHSLLSAEMTVDAWFTYWIENVKKGNIRKRTLEGYERIYNLSIRQYIGQMMLSEVKPVHCQDVLNQLKEERHYRTGTLTNIKQVMHAMFEYALENELVVRNPITKSIKASNGKPEGVEALTADEQKCFMAAAWDSEYYNQFALALQTGLRVGEIAGLKWSDIDFKNRKLHVKHSVYFDYKTHKWNIGEPKTESGKRDIPLTEEAIGILKNQKTKADKSQIVNMEFHDFVFTKNGEPIKIMTYFYELRKITKTIGMREISMHVFRHTFATRCIEGGMKPKTLQMILGHSTIQTTLDRYVHVTGDEKEKEMKSVEAVLKIV